MSMLWAVLFVALCGAHSGYGLPVRPTPQTYPHDGQPVVDSWNSQGVYAAIPALALVLTAVSLLFGCAWCYRHKDCKPNEGADNQLFTASASHIHTAQRVNPPDSGFSEPVNNNISEDNNNGPISLREMQNIANNNATAYIVSENEERNRISRESIVEFEPLPTGIGAIGGVDPLGRCADWFGAADFPRNNLQYLREIGRGWFGRVVEGEIDQAGAVTTVAVKILNQNATLEDKARFLDEAKLYRDIRHENVLGFVGRCLQEDPWVLIFDLYNMDLQQYLIENRPKMAVLNESGVPLRLMCDVSSALSHIHSSGFTYGRLWSGSVFIRGEGDNARAVLGRYEVVDPQHDCFAPEVLRRGVAYSANSEIWSLGTLIWEVCSWGSIPTTSPSPPPDLPCPYKSHLYQVMQLCWQAVPALRPSAAQVHALVAHLQATHAQLRAHAGLDADAEFEERWQRLKPNSIPVVDEHVALVHALECSPAPRRRSASLTNLHGSLDELCAEPDRAPSSLDPWLKDIVAGSQDDVSYYRDVSDVIKNLDNILNSEKTSSSESSHQASPSRDNLSLDCKKDYPVQSSLVKSPGISNFQNVLDAGFVVDEERAESCVDEEMDRETIGTLSHSFERHSDTISQQTLENLTPDTPMKDLDFIGSINKEQNESQVENHAIEIPEHVTEMPKTVANSKIPELKQLCKTLLPSLSDCIVEDRLNVQKDCLPFCDNAKEIRTDKNEAKSETEEREINIELDGSAVQEIKEYAALEKSNDIEYKKDEKLSTTVEGSSISNEGGDTLPSITEDVSNITQEDQQKLHFDDIETESTKTDNYSKDETILISDVNDTITDSPKHQVEDIKQIEIDIGDRPTEETPDTVQSIKENKQVILFTQPEYNSDIKAQEPIEPVILPPETVQNTNKSTPISETNNLVDNIDVSVVENEFLDSKENREKARSDDNYVEIEVREESSSSTVYMDLINNTNSEIIKDSDNSSKEIQNDHVKASTSNSMTCENNVTFMSKNESTEYLELPSFDVIKKTDDFLHGERIMSNNHNDGKLCASTPITSDNSGDMLDNTLENSGKELDTFVLSDTKVPICKRDSIKSEQYNLSPFDSPSKSLRTDTYDENSSVVLGPFENCTTDTFKSAKPTIDMVELPREELLAYSSNFSEINLETPSPLRDSNFLNEVPDIVSDDVHFDDIASIGDTKVQEPPSEETEDSCQSATEKRVSPSTPPNSPGIFLASTSQQAYIVDIDLNKEELPEPVSNNSVNDEIDLNQIELQITSKLAMAENENNLNIEYSGPLTVEGLIEEGGMMPESDAIPEAYLAGNGDADDGKEEIYLNEECVQALRNELELKLPLAQVAAIEPQCDGEWAGELPPPPEMVVNYPGALSPIAEETGQQLSAYENDMQWIASRTESSESYPEPCNNSSCTEAAPTLEQTYTLPSQDHEHPTYTVQRDLLTANTSREVTMSADSLNASPLKAKKEDAVSTIDDRTYNKDDEKESNCERISQVSPYLMSPTTDTSAPETSDNFDNPTGVSTLSKTTLPTDAKLSKPSEIQCLSKATSIDSWCSNDTLYNVEENFDDLAMDSELPLEFEKEEGNSESSDTLTHNDEDKEVSHCSTYIIHESKSEPCETFSPDSITANDNFTYTKIKTDVAGTTPSIDTELNDSTKNTQTKDLAYGTLMSGIPTYSNCTTEIASGMDEVWKLPQPELVRKALESDINMSSTKPAEPSTDVKDVSAPLIQSEPCINRMESVEITCLRDNSIESPKTEIEKHSKSEIEQLPNYNFRNIAPAVTSTPLVELEDNDENIVSIPMNLPHAETENMECIVNIPNFQSFQQSAEVRPQDLSSNASNECSDNNSTKMLLEGDSCKNVNNVIVSDRTPSYSDFENSAVTKPQDLNSRSSQSAESILSEEFRRFESSAKGRPQDLSLLIDASSLLLMSERMSSDFTMSASGNIHEQTSQSNSQLNDLAKSLDISPPSNMNLVESQNVDVIAESSNNLLINFGNEDETEQPHSIIVTEIPMNLSHLTPNKTFDSHITYNNTYDSHETNKESVAKLNTNGDNDNLLVLEQIEPINSPTVSNCENIKQVTSHETDVSLPEQEHIPNGTVIENLSADKSDIKLNGDSAKFATVSFLSESFEELIESNVDEGDCKEHLNEEPSKLDSHLDGTDTNSVTEQSNDTHNSVETQELHSVGVEQSSNVQEAHDGSGMNENGEKLVAVTEDFLQNEKKYCRLDAYLPMVNDIRFTGPATEIMSTSFTQDSPTDPNSPKNEQDSKPDPAADILKDWDSDSDSHSSNSSSGEFIWKDGDGHETSVVPNTQFEHQRNSSGGCERACERACEEGGEGAGEGGRSASGSSCSEGDEVEFVPSSWDARAAPAKSSLRTLEHAHPHTDSKKRVVFKRQKYHCVYEYPREASDVDVHSPAYLPDLSTYSEWDPSSAEEAELCYGQLFSSPSALSAAYPMRVGVGFGADYGEDFFISSSARPFEALGIMSTTSQFFPGMHLKAPLVEREPPDELPAPPSPPHAAPLAAPLVTPSAAPLATLTPSLDFTTPDSGVEDITPGSLAEDEFEANRPAEGRAAWRPADSGSSSESASPSAAGGEALGGLRHTRDRLKLDLPPSPHLPSPRHARVFSFAPDKPRRDAPAPLVMTDDTPLLAAAAPLAAHRPGETPAAPPEPTFSTFGKTAPKPEPEQKIVLTDEPEPPPDVQESPDKPVEPVKGEGTVLDSGDEDSGIESSSKATLERNKTSNVS